MTRCSTESHREQTILRSNFVIEFSEFDGCFYHWSATRERMLTYPVSRGITVDFTEAIAHEGEFPGAGQVYLPNGHRLKLGMARLIMPSNTWCCTAEGETTFDLILANYHGVTLSVSEGLRTPVRAYRYTMDTVPTTPDGFRLECRLSRSFHLPPIQSVYIPDLHPPGILGIGFGAGAGLMLVRYDTAADTTRGAARLPWGLTMYSLPKEVEDTVRAGGTNSDASPVEARLARLLDHDVFWGPRPSVCMASGRMYHHLTSTTVCISEFLPPWNGVE